MSTELVKTGVAVFMKYRDKLRMARADSLIGFTDVARVEPIVLIDQSVLHYDSIGEVQQSLLAMFSGYYLQSCALLNNVGGVSVIDRLDPLNPNRKAETSLLGGTSIAPWLAPMFESYQEKTSPDYGDPSAWMMKTESYAYGLPFTGDTKLKLSVESDSFASRQGRDHSDRDYGPDEWDDDKNQARPNGKPAADKNGKPISNSIGFEKGDINKTLNELANLSVGKTYGVEIKENGQSITMPVQIRLISTGMATRELIHILSTGSADNSWKERWHGFKSGRLAFWKDLVLCNDLVDQHRREMANDPTGVRNKLQKMQRSNGLATYITGNPTVASASNMVVISQETAEELELQLEGKLDKFDVRQRMMKSTYLMIIAVIDNDYGRVTFYHRGISMPTHVRLRDLKTSNKGSGPDIGDILKAYQVGQSPSL